MDDTLYILLHSRILMLRFDHSLLATHQVAMHIADLVLDIVNRTRTLECRERIITGECRCREYSVTSKPWLFGVYCLAAYEQYFTNVSRANRLNGISYLPS